MNALAAFLLLAGSALAAETTVTVGGRPLSGLQGAKGDPSAYELAPVSDWIDEPFDTVLLQGVLRDYRIIIEAARAQTRGTPEPERLDWVRAETAVFPGGRFWAKARLPNAARGRVLMRTLASGHGQAPGAEVFEVEAFTAAEDRESEQSAAASPAPVPVRREAPKPAVVPREDWGAKPPKEPYSPMTPVKITQHHTAGKRPTAPEEALAEMRFIQDFHQNGRGWIDIGYHFVIDGAGRIYQGRPETVLGTHVADHNGGNVGISLMGTYHPPNNDEFSAPQREALIGLLLWLRDACGISPDTYIGHRDYNPKTSCPGDLVEAELPALRDSMRAARAPFASAAGRLELERLPRLIERARADGGF